MIRRLAVLSLCLSAGVARAATDRLAIVVGNDYALGEQAPLRYAEEDAAKVASLLGELGNVPADNLFLLRGLAAADLRKAIQRVQLKTAQDHKLRDRSLLIFYFSGHSDGVSLELGADRVGFDELRKLLVQSGADVRVAIVDSCRSGSLLAAKGTKPGPAFDIRLSDDGPTQGTALLTSSAANEEALESKELHGSFFTHHLVSGLRGAADSSGDGLVTLSEAYQYAYLHTVAATADTIVGAQHPSFDYRLSGVGEIVLTEPRRSSAALTLPPDFDRALVTRQSQAVSEVFGGGGRRMGLPPGHYHVALWRQGRSLAANVDLVAGQQRELAWAELIPAAPAAFDTAKGVTGPQGQAELKHALSAFESFQDERATAELRALLARHPPPAITAKAHLYLGILLFNDVRTEQAREELKQAIQADPAIELPINMSPKMQLVFAEARRDLTREVEASPPSPPAPTLAPEAARTPTPEVAAPAPAQEQPASAPEVAVSAGPETPPAPRSHWLSYALGGAGVVAGALAIYGGAEVLTYSSTVKNAHGGSATAGQLDSLNAGFWSAGWIVAAALSAAGLTSAVITW